MNQNLMETGLGTIKGILISGAGGTGKTTMIKKI